MMQQSEQSSLSMRLRVLEEKSNNLNRKIEFLERNMVASNKKKNEMLRNFDTDLLDIKREIDSLKFREDDRHIVFVNILESNIKCQNGLAIDFQKLKARDDKAVTAEALPIGFSDGAVEGHAAVLTQIRIVRREPVFHIREDPGMIDRAVSFEDAGNADPADFKISGST